jgi:hypothetical protein
MRSQYMFFHTCGHTGIGPLLQVSALQTDIYCTAISTDISVDRIQLYLPFRCPFCGDSQVHESVVPGSGVLAILASPHNRPFAAEWQILRVCDADEVASHDWDAAHGEGGMFRQMAWISKPWGRVQVSSREQVGSEGRRLETFTQVDDSWTQSLRDPVRSRLPGMLSELCASLKSRGRQ